MNRAICLCVTIVQCQHLNVENHPSMDFKLSGLFFGCQKDVTSAFHYGLQEFSTRVLKQVAKYDNHFVISQYSIWLTLSAIAEGSSGNIQQELFRQLNLPEDWCLRQKYYEIATGLETPGLPEDVYIERKRFIILNDDVKLNNTWRDVVGGEGLINVKMADFNNLSFLNEMKNIISAKLDNFNVTGNSILFDTLDYKGLWSKNFENTSIEENADFFNDAGVKIATVDLIRIKAKVKLAHLPLLNAKLLELPVGNNERYRMLFLLNNRKKSIKRMIEHFPSTLIMDSFPLLLESVIPLEVAIPKFVMTSELDMKKVIENVGLSSVWENSRASTYISEPAALPSTLIQRVTVTVDSEGLQPLKSVKLPSISDVASGIAATIGRDFTANRPFVYGLVDSQTRSWLFAGVFAQPQ